MSAAAYVFALIVVSPAVCVFAAVIAAGAAVGTLGYLFDVSVSSHAVDRIVVRSPDGTPQPPIRCHVTTITLRTDTTRSTTNLVLTTTSPAARIHYPKEPTR